MFACVLVMMMTTIMMIVMVMVMTSHGFSPTALQKKVFSNVCCVPVPGIHRQKGRETNRPREKQTEER